MIEPVTALLTVGTTLIDKLFPDKKQADIVKLRMLKLQQDGELAVLAAETDLAKGQLQVNAEEAKSQSLFVSGWRPAVGRLCVCGPGYNFIGQPILSWASSIYAVPVPPQLEIGDLITLLVGMLGLGGLRTAEKLKGVARS